MILILVFHQVCSFHSTMDDHLPKFLCLPWLFTERQNKERDNNKMCISGTLKLFAICCIILSHCMFVFYYFDAFFFFAGLLPLNIGWLFFSIGKVFASLVGDQCVIIKSFSNLDAARIVDIFRFLYSFLFLIM